jgi:hypothetical protein
MGLTLKTSQFKPGVFKFMKKKNKYCNFEILIFESFFTLRDLGCPCSSPEISRKQLTAFHRKEGRETDSVSSNGKGLCEYHQACSFIGLLNG